MTHVQIELSITKYITSMLLDGTGDHGLVAVDTSHDHHFIRHGHASICLHLLEF